MVKDQVGEQKLACVYFEDDPGRQAAANQRVTRPGAIAANIAKLPGLLQR